MEDVVEFSGVVDLGNDGIDGGVGDSDWVRVWGNLDLEGKVGVGMQGQGGRREICGGYGPGRVFSYTTEGLDWVAYIYIYIT